MDGQQLASHTVASLAGIVSGSVAGDGGVVIQRARTISQACAGDITFLDGSRHERSLRMSNASAALVPEEFRGDGIKLELVRVRDPLDAFVRIFQLLHHRERPRTTGIHATASISPTAQIGQNVGIGPFVVIGEQVVIGDGCQIHASVVIEDRCRLGNAVVLHPHAVLYADTILGNRVIVHAGAVLGKDGFGFRVHKGRHVRVPQLGHLEIEDDVEVGANTTIDRSTFDVTRVGQGTKIDNQVQVGHNCQIGAHNVFVSQVGIAGSCKTGDYVTVAGQAGICNQVTIGDRATVAASSGVMNHVPAGTTVMGLPGEPEHEARRIYATIRRLPEMRHELRDAQKALADLLARINQLAGSSDTTVDLAVSSPPADGESSLKKSA